MSKELRELLNKLEKVNTKLENLMSEEEDKRDYVSIKAATTEMKNLNAQVEAQKLLDEGKEFDQNGVELSGTAAKQQKEEKENIKDSYKKAFMNSLRGNMSHEDVEVAKNCMKMTNALDPGTPANGGLLVPSDIQTAINQYKRTLPQLETLINTIPVTRPSGTRVFEKIATMVPFANITDLTADLPDMGNPTFENKIYAVKDYGGYMPVPNDLLDDSDQNILDYLTQWIARKSVVTRNGLITALLNTLTPTALADWKAIKKAINITLDPIFAASASIITNQDGYQYLDTLIDLQNRPLLQPDVKNPGGNVLFGKPITVVSNGTLATTGTTAKKAPMFIGNLQEMITMFERKGHQVASTNVGGTAFQKNRTEIRAIEREDIQTIDDAAVVYGQIDVTSVV